MGFTDQRIAVVGGGLGGMSFAASALHAGLTNIHVYEAASVLTEVGAGVNITRNANRLLDAMGVSPAMLEKSSHDPPSYMEYRHYRTGEFLGQIDEFGEPRSRQIHRAHLLDALVGQVPEKYVSLGKRLKALGFDAAKGCYVLQFTDETTAEADVVVGCDGIKSVVRAHLGLQDTPIYSGQMVYRGYIAYEDLSPATADMLRRTINFRGHQRHVLTLPIGNTESGTDRVGIIGFMTEPLEGWKSESWLATAPIDDMEAHLKGWCTEVDEIVAGLRKGSNDGNMLKQTLYVREPAAKWFETADMGKKGIVLLGDSVHSTLPHQGQGACQSIESGFALAQVLKNWPTTDLAAALQFFQDFRKPRTDRITQSSYETGKMASADIPEEEWSAAFNPDITRERMKWVMEFDLIGELFKKLREQTGYEGNGEGEARNESAGQVLVS